MAISEVTHGHFDSYDESLTPEQIENQIAAAVLDFWRIFSPTGSCSGSLRTAAQEDGGFREKIRACR